MGKEFSRTFENFFFEEFSRTYRKKGFCLTRRCYFLVFFWCLFVCLVFFLFLFLMAIIEKAKKVTDEHLLN